MKEIFDFVKDNILKGMPAGQVVTLTPPLFSINSWQSKTYDDNNKIKDNLKGKWASTLINIMILDPNISDAQLKKFMDENDFKKYGRGIFLIYCLVIETAKVNENIKHILVDTELTINRFSTIINHGAYSIFVNDFIKDILYI